MAFLRHVLGLEQIKWCPSETGQKRNQQAFHNLPDHFLQAFGLEQSFERLPRQLSRYYKNKEVSQPRASPLLLIKLFYNLIM